MKAQATATAPKLYIGIDAHKKNWTFHYRTELIDGKTIKQAAEPNTLIKWAKHHFPHHSVTCAYEAGFSGFNAARAFKAAGWEVLVLNPSDIPRTGKQHVVKNDKIDCRNICKQLSNNSIRSIEIPEEQREQFRSLFRERNRLVVGLRKVKCQIKSFLMYYSISIPEKYDNSNWTKKYIEWIHRQKLKYETANLTLDLLLKRYEFMHRELLNISTMLRGYARKHYKKDYYLLKTVPGIGDIVAVAILAEVGDLRRFNRLDELTSYIGLVPRMFQSGEKIFVNGITPRAKKLLRSYIVEASWQAIRVDPVLQNYYQSHYGKKPKSIIVAYY